MKVYIKKDYSQLHQDFILLNKTILAPSGILAKNIQVEKESQEYGALQFDVMEKKIKFRVAKTTPKKVGYFVTLWKRVKGVTVPHDKSDTIDFFIISVRNEDNIGFFLLSKDTLIEHKIFSSNGCNGKRGIRVYPPWSLASNKQARSTQYWQDKHFYDISKPNYKPNILKGILEKK